MLALLSRLVLRLPASLAVALISGVALALSVAATLATAALLEGGFGPYLRTVLALAVAVPLVVATPVGAVVVGLVKEGEAARQRAQDLAWRDELTGLLNRRRFIELGQREMDLAHRSGSPLAVAVLDLDDFKRINDVFGHSAGDSVLQAAAAACRRALRSTDLIARWGGEEFAMALPCTGEDGALEVAGRILGALAGGAAAPRAGSPIGCTASIGVAFLDSRSKTVFDLLGLADAAMYEAKKAGKNRVVMAPVKPPGDQPCLALQ
jgi:diguanylate cyclase (GGDEF)-like protein